MMMMLKHVDAGEFSRLKTRQLERDQYFTIRGLDMKRLLITLIAGFLLLQPACKNASSKNDEAKELLGFGIVYLNSIWQKITVADVPSFSFTNKDGDPMTPSCACPPEYEASTQKTTKYNPEFAFFYKPGKSKNLLIFFMGGGACWDITNCAYNHTYSGELIESNLLLGLASTGGLEGSGLSGIMDVTDPNNPFKDWSMVWVPYCTADLGTGQKDHTYPEDYGTAYPGGVTIRHRGRVNLELVLQWLQANITTAPDKLFVTGSSAGSYATYLSYPLIRNVFNSSSTKAYVLGDAGEGFAGEYDPDGDGPTAPTPFIQLVSPFWGLELPPITAFSGKTPLDYTEYKELVQAIVDNYPDDKFAQYTTKWDKTQIWFYDIQKDNNIHHPDQWGAEEDAAADPTSAIAIEWNAGMMDAIDITGANYWYYIGPGTHHTIDLTPAFYTETSNGTYFYDWVTAFVNDDAMSKISCSGAECDVQN